MTMKWIPYAAHALIHTADGPTLTTQLLPIGVLEQLGLLCDGIRHKIAHADSSLASIDISSLNDRMPAGAGRDGDFYRRVLAGECGEVIFEEGAVIVVSFQMDKHI